MAKKTPAVGPPEDKLLGHIEAALDVLAAREEVPYDGVLGVLPAWVPDHVAREFVVTRDRLLDRCAVCEMTHSADEVRQWMANHRVTWKTIPGFRSVPYVPIAHEQDVGDLVEVQEIVNRGEVEGVRVYLGEGQYGALRAHSLAERNRANAKRPRTDGLQKVIVDVLRRQPAALSNDVLAELRRLAHKEVDGVTIEEVTEDSIEWHDDKKPAASTPISGLKDRVARARKVIESR